MSLRQARINDHWRHTYSRTYKTRFTEVTVNGLGCLANATIEFSSGLSAIVGANGVGKSTLVAAITQLLSPDPNSVEQAFRSRLAGSSLDGIAYHDGAKLKLSVRDNGSGLRVPTGAKFTGDLTWLDPSTVASRYVDQFHKDTNFHDLLDQVTPLQLESDDIKTASYLVGKNYTDIAIFEISDYAGLERFPYFRATSAGVTYSSEAMGRGELSLLLTYWTLVDMPGESILILEEPETHVSPQSQDCLMNIIAKFCDERGIWVIVTTHSPTVTRRIPNEHIKLLVRDMGPAAPIRDPKKLDISLLLGGGVAYKGMILVEDEGAKQFLLAILENLDPDLLRQLEIIPAGSEGSITGLLKAMPQTRSWLTLIGVYDADMQGQISGADFNWPFKFLPGEADPDRILTQLAHTTSNMADLLSPQLQKTTDQIQIALSHVAGADYHDFLGTFASALSISASLARRGFARIWLQKAENLSAAEAFIESLRKSLRDAT